MNLKNLRLSLILAFTEFKLKNEGSYLGLLWYVLNPLLLFIVLLLIFSDRIGNNIPYYPIYMLIGLIMFNLFRQITLDSTKYIINHDNLLKSIKLPNRSFILSLVLKNLFSHIIEIILLVILFLLLDVSPKGLIFYPLIIIFFCIFLYGLSLILAVITIYFFDLENIWIFFSLLLWMATPIFYDIGGQTRLLIFNLFNPLYYFITITREVLLYNKIPELWMILLAVTYSFLFFVIGSWLFIKLEDKFAEFV